MLFIRPPPRCLLLFLAVPPNIKSPTTISANAGRRRQRRGGNGHNDRNFSGTISTTSFTDRLVGRLSSLVSLKLIDGIDDHDRKAYIHLFKKTVIDSRKSLMDKTKSVMMDAAKKVSAVADTRYCLA